MLNVCLTVVRNVVKNVFENSNVKRSFPDSFGEASGAQQTAVVVECAATGTLAECQDCFVVLQPPTETRPRQITTT